jgi:predicted RNA-binding protein YlxR (DUF448 family)
MPERTCRVCRMKRPKTELVRWTVGELGQLRDDQVQAEGRGLYSCPGSCSDKLSQGKGRKQA